MEELLPSEIARLVLGYLKENKCERTWHVFLEECGSLGEYYKLYKEGKQYPTNVHGKSLMNIMGEFINLKREIKNDYKSFEFTEKAFEQKCKIILEEAITKSLSQVLQKCLPCFCNQHQKKESPIDATLRIHSSQRDNSSNDFGNEVETSKQNSETIAPDKNTVEILSNISELNQTLNATPANVNCSKEQSSLINISKVNTIPNLQLIESSVSDAIYMQDIIKVEKENEQFSNLENILEKVVSIHSSNQQTTCDSVYTNPESNIQLHSSENGSNELVRNPDTTVSNWKIKEDLVEKSDESDLASHSPDIEIIKTIKGEPHRCEDLDVKPNISSCFQNAVNTTQIPQVAEISQSVSGSFQNSVAQIGDIGSSISSSTIPPGYTLQNTPFSNQTMAVTDSSFSTVPTYLLQNYSSNSSFLPNNGPYTIVINNAPTGSAGATVHGYPLTLSSINSNNIGPTLTSVNSLMNNIAPAPAISVSQAISPVLNTTHNVASRNTASVTSTVPTSTVDNAAPNVISSQSAPPSNNLAENSAPSRKRKLSQKKTPSEKTVKRTISKMLSKKGK